MPIIGRQTWSNDIPPTRGYVYAARGTEFSSFEVNNGLSCLVSYLDRIRKDELESHEFVIAFVGGTLHKMTPEGKVFTLFGYEPHHWSKKRNHDPFVTVSTHTVLDKGEPKIVDYDKIPLFRDDMFRILALEAEHRETTKNVREYMNRPPRTPGIELLVDKISDLPPA